MAKTFLATMLIVIFTLAGCISIVEDYTKVPAASTSGTDSASGTDSTSGTEGDAGEPASSDTTGASGD